MKIIFICSSLLEGSDGVGDHTRRMASELIRSGHEAALIALNDPFINPRTPRQVQHDQGVAVNVLRLSSRLPWSERLQRAGEYISQNKPDWISLHYVPYGYHKKGLPFGLASALKKITANIPCHIMFHEMWVGITRVSPLKHKFYGFFQIRIAKKLIRELAPQVITTSNRLYQLVLESKEIKAVILPLFSNITFLPKDEQFVDAVYQQLGIPVHTRQQYVMIGLFGSLYPGSNLESTLEQQYEKVSAAGKKLAFVAFGRIGSLEEYERLKTRFEKSVAFAILGTLPEAGVSNALQMLDKVILGTPSQHYGKSSVYAALKLHQLEVLPSVWNSIPEYDKQISDYNEFLEQRNPEHWSVQFISGVFLNMLNSKKSTEAAASLT